MHCGLTDQPHREAFSQTYLDNECLQHKRRSYFNYKQNEQAVANHHDTGKR